LDVLYDPRKGEGQEVSSFYVRIQCILPFLVAL
jgi:hypothetical protein